MPDIARKETSVHWANIKEAGSILGIRFLFAVNGLFGRKIFSLVLVPVTLYYMAIRTTARRASTEYLTQLHQQDPNIFKTPPGIWVVARHILSFCQAALDKLLAWRETIREEDFHIVDQEAFDIVLNDRADRSLLAHTSAIWNSAEALLRSLAGK